MPNKQQPKVQGGRSPRGRQYAQRRVSDQDQVMRKPNNKSIAARASDPLSKARNLAFQTIEATEWIQTVIVPTASARGELLATIEVSPQAFRLAKAASTQAQSWAGDFKFGLRTNGSVNAKNYCIGRFLPNAEPSVIPQDPVERWAFIRSSRKLATNGKKQADDEYKILKYNVISDQIVTIDAPWKYSYNPIKPVIDDNPTEANLGLFVIVGNGPPGEDVVVDIEVSYKIYLIGPTPRSVLVDNSVALKATPSGLNAPIGTSISETGNGYISILGTNTIVIPTAGNYLVNLFYTGTGITGNPAVTISNGLSTGAFPTFNATSASLSFSLSVPNGNCNLVLGALPASTFTLFQFKLAPFTAPQP